MEGDEQKFEKETIIWHHRIRRSQQNKRNDRKVRLSHHYRSHIYGKLLLMTSTWVHRCRINSLNDITDQCVNSATYIAPSNCHRNDQKSLIPCKIMSKSISMNERKIERDLIWGVNYSVISVKWAFSWPDARYGWEWTGHCNWRRLSPNSGSRLPGPGAPYLHVTLNKSPL